MKRLIVTIGALVLLELGSIARAESDAVRILAGTREPQVAVSPTGGVYVVAATRDGTISIASSTDGRDFLPAVQVGKVDKLMLGMRRGPRVAVTEKAVVVTAIGSWQGQEGELLSFHSSDGGASWSGPTRVNSQAGSAIEGLHGLAGGPKNEVACVWLDLRNRTTEVYASVSSDGGLTWKKDALAYRSPSGTVCECCHPSVAYAREGGLAIMFRNSVDGARDLWIVRSPDLGKSWRDAHKLGEGSWELKRCPMDGGGIVGAAKGGTFWTVWRRGEEIFVASAGKAERSLGAGIEPVIADGPGGSYLLWLEKRGGELRFLAPKAKAIQILSPKAGDPSVAGSPDGRGPVVAVWGEGDQVTVRTLAARN